MRKGDGARQRVVLAGNGCHVWAMVNVCWQVRTRRCWQGIGAGDRVWIRLGAGRV